MEISVEIKPEADFPETRETAGKKLGRLVKDTIGISARIDVRRPSLVERSTGKARRVIDHRKL